jgi:hypothetical protein
MPPVTVLLEKDGQALSDAEEAKHGDRAVLLGVADQGGGIEVGLGVVECEHERWFVVTDQDVAHDERAGTVIALNEQLGPAQDAEVGAGSPAPGRLVLMLGIPLDEVLDPAALLVVEAMRRGGDVMGDASRRA